MKNKNKDIVYIEKYIDEILNPLHDFYTTNYNCLLEKNGDTQKIVEDAYDLYFEKLENLFQLIEHYMEKTRKL